MQPNRARLRALKNSAPRGVELRSRVASLAIAAEGLPTEFRLFVRGVNETENGSFVFDEQAATATMAAYASWGVDCAIDLEHLSLEDPETSVNYDPDARGWAKLELREDGSLWAVGVTWTPDGAARLTEKRQRYVSPAFAFDPETKRVEQIINVAIVALPATHGTPALMAASARRGASTATITVTATENTAVLAAGGGNMLDGNQIKEALDALIAGDDAKCAELLKGIIASAAGADPDAGTEDAPPPVGDGGADEGAEAPPAAASAAAPPAPAAEDPKKKAPAMMAAARVACAMTGKADIGEAMAELARRSAIATDLETREAKLKADQAMLEAGERRRLVGDLVKLGRETPATAWADDKGTVPADEYASMPIARLRDKVAKFRASAPAALNAAPKPPTKPATEPGSRVVGGVLLTASEIATVSKKCKQLGEDAELALEKYAAIVRRQGRAAHTAEG